MCIRALISIGLKHLLVNMLNDHHNFSNAPIHERNNQLYKSVDKQIINCLFNTSVNSHTGSTLRDLHNAFKYIRLLKGVFTFSACSSELSITVILRKKSNDFIFLRYHE